GRRAPSPRPGRPPGWRPPTRRLRRDRAPRDRRDRPARPRPRAHRLRGGDAVGPPLLAVLGARRAGGRVVALARGRVRRADPAGVPAGVSDPSDALARFGTL